MSDLDVLVTGAAGFLGRATLVRLADARQSVLGCDIVEGPSELGVPYVRGDVRDASQMNSLLERWRPRTVVHLAAAMDVAGDDPRHVVESNVTGTANLLAAAESAGTSRFIFGSSVMVYGPRSRVGEQTVREDAVLDARTLYGSAKVFAEQLLLQPFYRRQMQTGALRFTTVYGPGRLRRGAFPQVVDVFQAAAGQPVDIDVEQATDVIHVNDAASAVVAAVGCPEVSGPYNIGHHQVTGGDLLSTVRALRPDVRARETRGERSTWPADVGCRRAQVELRWRPQVSLAEGAEGVTRWFETRHEATTGL